MASQTIAGYWLPPILYRYHVAHPGVVVELHIGNTQQVSRAVLDGAADLGFVEGDVDEPVLAQIPVAVDQLVLVVAKSHELASVKSIDLDQLLRARWVLREKGSGTRQVFEDDLRRRGVDPTDLDVEDLHWAVGTGLSVRAAGVKIRVDVGLRVNRRDESGTWENTEFHFGVGDSF